jgi:hypothetical protein
LIDKRDLKSLCEVSRTLYEETVPQLYRSLSLYASEDDIENISAPGLVDASRRGLLGHTRNLRLWVDFSSQRLGRCMHGRNEAYLPRGDRSKGEVELLVDNLETTLSGLEANSIRTLE